MRDAWGRQGACRRVAVGSVAALVFVLCLAAGTSVAAAPRSGALVRWRSMRLARVAPPRLAAAVTLVAGPREVLISGVRYEMRLLAFAFPGIPQFPPSVVVDLARSAPPGGSPIAFQSHDYVFDPQSGATFTIARRTLATATLDMAASIAPSMLTTTFTASGRQTTTACSLSNGGHGNRRHVSGTLAYAAFSIATPTSPFFGTLTGGPVRARLIYDPGCKGSAAPPPSAENRGCPGRESLEAGSQTQSWSFEKIRGRRAVSESVFTGTNPASPSVASEAHSMAAITAVSTLPRPAHSTRGATAEVFAAGNPFMTGSATFASTRAPAITHHSCIDQGRTLRFTTRVYTGLITPNTTPLTAGFDTGPLALTQRRATLKIRRYR